MSTTATTSTRRFALVVGVTLALALPSAVPSGAEGPPGPTADIVYGQLGSFTSDTANNGGISANSLSQPDGAVADDQGNLYVTDTLNHRVLFYPAGSTTATRVYGQAGSFTTGSSNMGSATPTADTLSFPRGLALDSGGNLYVADAGNHRVLFYPAGSTTATRVYGQAGSFTTNTVNNGGISANSLQTPSGVALDSFDNLYVVEFLNHRALFFPSGSTTATRVYGQNGNFATATSNNGGLSANSLSGPSDVAVDGNNALYLSDFLNNRVLFYLNGSTTATGVYGQVNFTSAVATASATGLNGPLGVAVDTGNNLYVADQTNNRVLFYPASSKTATAVYGQPDFTTATPNTGGLDAGSIESPRRIAPAANNDIYVIDLGNNRALKYVAHDLAVLKVTAPATVGVDTGGPVTKPVTVQIQNRGSLPEVLPSLAVLGNGTTTGLVRLTVSLVDNDSETCQPAIVALHPTKNATIFSGGAKTIKRKAKLTIHYLVTYECDNPAVKMSTDTTPGDYSHTATVFRSLLGDADSHGEDDGCPRFALDTFGHRDPNPDGTIVDKGCGARQPDGTFGKPILTNIFLR
jgi:sugar lactone lactonase YvrE